MQSMPERLMQPRAGAVVARFAIPAMEADGKPFVAAADLKTQPVAAVGPVGSMAKAMMETMTLDRMALLQVIPGVIA